MTFRIDITNELFGIKFLPRLPALEKYLESMVNLPSKITISDFISVIDNSIFTVYTIYNYITSGSDVCLPNDFWVNFVTKSSLTLVYRSACSIDFEFNKGIISACCIIYTIYIIINDTYILIS